MYPLVFAMYSASMCRASRRDSYSLSNITTSSFMFTQLNASMWKSQARAPVARVSCFMHILYYNYRKESTTFDWYSRSSNHNIFDLFSVWKSTAIESVLCWSDSSIKKLSCFVWWDGVLFDKVTKMFFQKLI